MKNIKCTLAVVLVSAALGTLIGGIAVRADAAEGASPSPGAAAPGPSTPATATADAAPAKSDSSSPAKVEKSGPAAAAKPAKTAAAKAEKGPPADEPVIQVSGRVIHTWYEKPGLRVILIIDGFTVMTREEQLTARDGVIWFDEEEAKKTGRATLGIYAETGVEYRRASGQVEKYDSVYVMMSTTGELSLNPEEPPRGRADGTELYLRARKLRDEYLKGVRETPTGVVPAPQPGPKVEPPGVREAGVPQEITIVAQDDVRQVNFTSFVENGVRISIWSGGVYVTRGDMDMAADNLVIWTPEETVKKATGGGGGGAAADSGKRLAAEAYFEGHVRIIQARRVLQCSQLFYDFEREQALAINTKLRTYAKGRSVPVYYYAEEVRQLARGVFVGTNSWMTTCEFAEPHSDIRARKLTMEDLTPEAPLAPKEVAKEPLAPPLEPEPAPAGQPTYHRIRFLGEDVSAEIRSMPLTYWPRLAGDFTEANTALRSVRIENRRNRGTGIATQWHLMKLLGIENEPTGFDFYLDADGWSKRGPAIGVEGQYARRDFYGQLLTYYIHDSGEDSVGQQNIAPPGANRGRATWRHRQFIPDNWELTLEASYISDRNFMHEFFQEEDQQGKAQETLLYLKRQEHEQALTILASARVEDFYTRTEYYPQIRYNVIGHSLLDDRLTYFQGSELAIARWRPDTALGLEGSGSTLLADTIHEVDLPLKFGVFNLVPFAEGRLSYFSDSLDGGSKFRTAAREGIRGATQLWKVYDDVESEFWDIHRLRHVNVFDFSAYAHQVSVPSRELFPFAPTEYGTPPVQGVDSTQVVELGWRQRFDTKRGPPGKQESVDFLTTDLEATFYSNREFPNMAPDDLGPVFNKLDFRVHWRATDSTTLWHETEYNMDSGKIAKLSVGALITHTPRLTYTVGQRWIPENDSSVTFFGFDYQINDKWRVTLLEQYDFSRNTNARTDIILTRRLHEWLMRIKFRHTAIQAEQFAGIEFQPIGISEVRVGW